MTELKEEFFDICFHALKMVQTYLFKGRLHIWDPRFGMKTRALHNVFKIPTSVVKFLTGSLPLGIKSLEIQK